MRRHRALWILTLMSFGCVTEAPLEPPLASVPAAEATPAPIDEEGWDVLEARVVDHNHALRTASLKLVQALPTLQQIRHVELAADPAAAYEEELGGMLADARFRRRMVEFWRDTMRQGGAETEDRPSRDTAPTLAARIVVEQLPFSELFTAATNDCPTYDWSTDTFVDGDCDNGAPVHAGVLTNPGTLHQFYGNMAFRRVRWVQEIFVCTKFPAELVETPTEIDGAQYVSPWPIETIANEPIAFRDTASVLCANCHTTMNHVAPLFAPFDDKGVWKGSSQVFTPTAPAPVPTELSHWLMPGQVTAWRFGEPVADLAELGAAVAADPAVAECVVTRLWNLVMSKEDVVTELATVPYEVLEPYVEIFHDEGENVQSVLRAMFTSPDFVRR